jgi:hypothetical protein
MSYAVKHEGRSHVEIKQIGATAALAGALGAAAFGVGAGLAQAKPQPAPSPIPTPSQLFQMPPGLIMQVPTFQTASGTTFANPAFGVAPGQFNKIPTVPSTTSGMTIPNPFFDIPPGHWDGVTLPANFG